MDQNLDKQTFDMECQFYLNNSWNPGCIHWSKEYDSSLCTGHMNNVLHIKLFIIYCSELYSSGQVRTWSYRKGWEGDKVILTRDSLYKITHKNQYLTDTPQFLKSMYQQPCQPYEPLHSCKIKKIKNKEKKLK